jgi:hypothetical protein
MPIQITNHWKTWLIGFATLGLSACGGNGNSNDVLGYFSTGQVKSQTGNSTVLEAPRRWSKKFGKRDLRSGLTINLSCQRLKLTPHPFWGT